MSAIVEAEEAVRRIRAIAEERGVAPQVLLTRYGLERFLYRLSIWEQRQRSGRAPSARDRFEFVLKGAWCFMAWEGDMYRPTRDLDLHRFGDSSEERLLEIVREVCGIEGADDVVFEPTTIRSQRIVAGQPYEGVRIKLHGKLGRRTRLAVSLDIVPGDDIFDPKVHRITTLLAPLPEPTIAVYSRESVIAEKLHTIAVGGMLNSRIKDYIDIERLAIDPRGFRGERLAGAIERTFRRRATDVPSPGLDGLSDEYVSQSRAWRKDDDDVFRRRLARICGLVDPILDHIVNGAPRPAIWTPTGGWR